MTRLKTSVTGPDGKQYPTWAAMCEAYDMEPGLVAGRVKLGWSIMEALLIPPGAGLIPVAYKGVRYPSLMAACKALGVDYGSAKRRYGRGLPLELVLNPALNPDRHWVRDHTGRKFHTYAEMCRAWNIPLIRFNNRRRAHWSVEDALTTPLHGRKVIRRGHQCSDHTGREFKTVKEMCAFWNVSQQTYCTRRKRGWPIELALTLRPDPSNRQRPRRPLSYLWDDELGRYVR